MIIRAVNESDIPEISTWFESISWDLPPVENSLPKQGFLAEQDGKLLACAWLYTSGTSIAEIGWTCTNPKSDSKLQSDAISAVVEFIQKEICKVSGIKSLKLYTKNMKFVQKLEGLNFRKKFPFYQMTWVSRDESA